jgi:iron complex transport system substrate-binding protein
MQWLGSSTRTIGTALLLASCARPTAAAVSAWDDMGVLLHLVRPAQRVVSLAPSSTEMLFAIGAAGKLVGVSNADDYPPAARRLPKVGSYSGPDMERIVAARPDLVVAVYGNPLELIAQLRRRGIPVFVSNPRTVDGVLHNLVDLGQLTGERKPAETLVRSLHSRLARVRRQVQSKTPVKTLVVVWDEPLTVAGGRSFIQDVLRCAGGANAAGALAEAYPKLDPERLLLMDPEVIVFPVAPVGSNLSRLESRPGVRQTRAGRGGRVYALNPVGLERSGPRVVLGIEALANLLHPTTARPKASK